MSHKNENKPNETEPKPAAYVPNKVGDEVRGDKILVTARKFNKASVVRRTGNHNASEMVVEKDARATVLRAYTSTSN